MKELRIVIDANVWISMFIGKRLNRLIPFLDNGKIRLILSDSLLNELCEVIKRPKFRKYFSEEFAVLFMRRLANNMPIYHIENKTSRCRDSKDDYLLELALQSNADYLVTGDDDLLVLQKIEKTAIVSPADFRSILEVL